MKRLAMINSDGKSAPVTDDPTGVTTELVGLRRRVFARTPARRILTDLLTVDAAEGALSAGADGIYVDSFADYGVTAIRGVTDRPVIGAGEAVLTEAVALGTFAVVTVWPVSLEFIYTERLAAVPGATSACLGVHHYSPEGELDLVGTGTSVRARMVRREDDLVVDLIRTCHEVRETKGVAGIVLGCTCMAPVADEIAAACDFPVFDPARIGLAAARTAVLSTPPGDREQAHVRDRLVASAVETWLAHTPEETGDDCVVCAIRPLHN